MRYRIGQISKMLNTSVETIRFLEQKGLIIPEKDAASGYRYYNIWDVNLILDYQKYRQIGFSSKEAVSLARSSNIDHFIAKLAEKEDEAEFLARFYEAKAAKLRNYQTVLVNAKKMLGRYIIMNSPENYSLFLRSVDADRLHVVDARESEGSYEEMTKYYPFAEHIYRIKQEWLDSEKHRQDAQWGFTMKKRWVDALEIRHLPQMEHIESTTALFTVIPVGERQFFSADLLTETFSYMAANDYQLSGNIMGVYLATVNEGGQRIRYMEVWVPVKSTDYAPAPVNEFDSIRQAFG